MKKIFVDKNEDIASVVEKVIGAPEEGIIIIVPKNSKLRESASNFSLLKREADGAGKNITIESVDDVILSLAQAHELRFSHPLFSGAKSLSDIVPKRKHAGSEAKKGSEKKVKLHVIGGAAKKNEEEEDEEETTEEPQEEYSEDETTEKKKSFLRRPIAKILAAIIILLAVGAVLASTVWSKANISVTLEKKPWSYSGTVKASKATAEINTSSGMIPGQMLTDKKTITKLFLATGRSENIQKATGKITIYNAFNTSPQTLVGTTRFMTPDGKIFRLDKTVTVPGGTMRNGVLQPGSVEANVTADKGGPEYNLSPVERLTIPGFEGTSRYQGFYGSLKDGTSGGALQGKPVVIEADIEKGKAETSEILKTLAKSNITSLFPEDFRVIDGASSIEVTKLTVNRTVDQSGNFAVFGEVQIKTIGFRESDLKEFLRILANRDSSYEEDFKGDPQPVFEKVSPDFAKGELSFTVKMEGDLVSRIKGEELKNSLLGLRVENARTAIATLPGLESGEISLWPIWLRKLPQDQGRITLKFD